jgi:phosphoglycerate kinase
MEQVLRTMDDIPLDGKRVIVRVDFNVSVGSDGVVNDQEDYRIKAALSTIQELQQRRCKVLLLSHLGRPEESDTEPDMKPIHTRLERLLHEEVRLLPKLYGSSVDAVISGMEPGGVALFPNVRLDDREMTNSEKFGQDIAASGEAYINEAFSVCHRAHTSLTVLPRLLPSAAGRRTIQEVTSLAKLRQNPGRPYVAIVSGAKITTKVGMLRRLLTTVDTLCVGGQIANIFLAAKGKWDAGKFHAEEIAAAKSLLEEDSGKLLIPVDVMIGGPEGQDARYVSVDSLPPDTHNLWDIGPKSVEHILNVCSSAKTVMWNGPVGMFEVEAYARSTKGLAEGLAAMSVYKVVGGGDTVNALEAYSVSSKYDHVSVGGGAMVAFLEGKRMPGLEGLSVE